MYQPQLIEVDPQRIKFSAHNPRKHGGEEYERLKQSIQEMGIIQPPLVRHTTGIFYEVIDGEGRVSVAQDIGLTSIRVVNLGDITEDEALGKLVTSNTVRTFDYLAQCRGMANLYSQGKNLDKIAKMLGIPYPGQVSYYVGVGYFPKDIKENISIDMFSSEERSQIWTKWIIRSLLPLRQLQPGKDAHPGRGNTIPMDETLYNFDEVRRAVKMVIEGEISTGIEMRAYVAERQRELFAQQFDQELQAHLEEELVRAKKALEDAKTYDIEQVAHAVRMRYQSEIDRLETQIAKTMKERDEARETTVASERDKKLIKELQQAIDAQKKAESSVKDSIRKQERDKAEAEYKEWKAKYEAEVKARREAIEKERAEAKAKLEEEQKLAKDQLAAYYKQQDAKRQLKAEASYRQLIASASEHLSQSNQSVLNLTSTGMIQGLEWLSQDEIGSLLFTIRATRNNLEEVEQAIQKRLGIVSSEDSILVVDNQIEQRSVVNHHG